LMFAAGAGDDPQKREGRMDDGGWTRIGRARHSPRHWMSGSVRADRSRIDGGQRIARPAITMTPAFDPIFGLRGRAVGADAILDGDPAVLIPAERGVNEAVVVANMAVDDGEVFFLDGAGLPDFSQFAGGPGIFGEEDDAAGFAVEAIDEVGLGSGVRGLASGIGKSWSRLTPAATVAEVQPGAADEAGKLIPLGGMADEAGRFVDDEQVGVFMEDGQEVFQAQERLAANGRGVKRRGGDVPPTVEYPLDQVEKGAIFIPLWFMSSTRPRVPPTGRSTVWIFPRLKNYGRTRTRWNCPRDPMLKNERC